MFGAFKSTHYSLEGFRAKIRCNLNDISYLSETQKNYFQILSKFKLVIVCRFYEQIYLSIFSSWSNLFLVLCAVPQAREPCTRAAQSSRVGCSRRVHKIVYLAVKKGNILVNIFLLEYSSLMIVTYKSSCVSD